MSDMLGHFFQKEKKGKERLKELAVEVEYKNEKTKEREDNAKIAKKEKDADRLRDAMRIL